MFEKFQSRCHAKVWARVKKVWMSNTQQEESILLVWSTWIRHLYTLLLCHFLALDPDESPPILLQDPSTAFRLPSFRLTDDITGLLDGVVDQLGVMIVRLDQESMIRDLSDDLLPPVVSSIDDL